MVDVTRLEPMPAYFLIRIGKDEQREKREKEGRFYVPESYVFMKREIQFGEIISIGSAAKEYMPLAEKGDYLLFHHLVSGKKDDRGHSYYLIEEDADFNYYAVNAFEIPGERPLAYAIAKGEEIIPTPDYIFLEVPKEENVTETNESGITVVKAKQKTRDEWSALLKANMNRMRELSRNIPYSEIEYNSSNKEVMNYAINEIKRLEQENARISKELNKRKYERFVIAALNQDWNDYIEKMFGQRLHEGEEVYMLNMACKTIITFGESEFIIAQTTYFGCPLNYAVNAVAHHNATRTQKTNTVRDFQNAD